MVKNHLKRIATPRAWNIRRKDVVFITRPKPGAHSMQHALSLNTFLKEYVELSGTTKESKKIIHDQELLVDGKRRHSRRHNVGFMDVVALPAAGKQFRVVFDQKGRIATIAIPKDEAGKKLARIVGKTIAPKGKTSLRLHDGRTLLVADAATHKVGDTLLISLPDQKIEAHFPLAQGATVMVYKGKHAGTTGTIAAIETGYVQIAADGERFRTKSAYAFVIGDKKAAIKCSP